MNEKRLTDKVIVVYGGTKGVGRAIVKSCAKEGAVVIFTGRDRESGRKILSDVENFGGKCEFHYINASDTMSINSLFDRTYEKHGKIDGYVNYAGTTPVQTLADSTEDVFDNVFNVNIRAPFFFCKNAIKYMTQNKKGSIILIGSAHSWSGQKDRAAYACSKGALYTLFEHIAHNYAKDGIRCNFLTMGWTPTEGEVELRKTQGISESELREKASKILPMGRMLETSDYTEGVLYLLSDTSSMVTGSNLRITGGEYI